MEMRQAYSSSLPMVAKLIISLIGEVGREEFAHQEY